MWSNQNADAVYFATHADGNDDDTAFVAEEPPIDRPNGADDHINLKSLQAGPDGQVFAAVKTSATEQGDTQTLLLPRNPDGTFEEHVFGTAADDHTRPIVLKDEQNRDLYVFAAVPTGGGRSSTRRPRLRISPSSPDAARHLSRATRTRG